MTRVQLNNSWIANVPIDTAKNKLKIFLVEQKMNIVSERYGETIEVTANQGSQLSTRVWGGWYVEPTIFPKRAKIRIHPTSDGVQIEADIEETMGFGYLDPYFKKRYEDFFQKWMIDLKSIFSPTTEINTHPSSYKTPDVTIYMNPEPEKIRAATETVQTPLRNQWGQTRSILRNT